MRLIDKSTIPRMPWHDMSLCMVCFVFYFILKKKKQKV